MQRYHGASGTSAVNNGGLGGLSSRDTNRADSSSVQASFSINSRRSVQLTPYRLKCDKEPLNSRLGPPDFHPPTPNCPEETLTREYVQSGYRETVDGIEDARELSLTQVAIFVQPITSKCKEAIRKRLRAINESRAQKRKAGQVYGVPLSSSLLCKTGSFPEQRAFGEDSRKRWIEGLSQYHKSLYALADNIPHGYRKKSLFEVLIKNNVPLLRATWFIKVTYLNQIRPGASNVASEITEKAQLSRTELWTKDVIDYLQYLLDEYLSKNYMHPLNQNHQSRDRSSQMLYAQNKSDVASGLVDGEEPSLHFKWWYVVRLLHCHCSEGLILSSHIINWFIQQLQDKDLNQVLQLLLPIIYGLVETVILSQTCVRSLVDAALRFLKEPSSGGSDLVDNSRRAYTTSALVEMLRYLILSAPDTFVGLDCFPLPHSVVTYIADEGTSLSKLSVDPKRFDSKYQSLCFSHGVSSIQKRGAWLTKAATPGTCAQNGAKTVQELNTSLIKGDVERAFKSLFEDVSDTMSNHFWFSEVSPCLRSMLKWIDSLSLSFICSVFLLCEWCTCDFGGFRYGPIHQLKFTGRKDYSQIHVAVRLLKMKMRDVQRLVKAKSEQSELFESPNPLHDVIVCWLDQHEVHSGEGSERVQLLIVELICSGIFYPPAYVRQLIVSGVMDSSGTTIDLNSKNRHFQVLKHLPPAFVQDAIKTAQIISDPVHDAEAIRSYGNERRLLLRGQNLKSKTSSVNQPKKVLSRCKLYKYSKSDADIEELKSAISVLLLLPKMPVDNKPQSNLKRPAGLISNNLELLDSTPACEECQRAKRQKLGDDKSFSPDLSDDEGIWWARMEIKSVELYKVDSPLKPAKLAPKGRQKSVRKTQSLAHLASARIGGSQGASTSHVCDNRTVCPHHNNSSFDVETLKFGDIVSIGKMLKKMRYIERRSLSSWLMTTVKQLVEESDKAEERNSVRWKLGDDELSAILYLMDAASDLSAAVRFIIWLLPKAVGSTPAHSGRNVALFAKNTENHVCEAGEPFLLSCIRRYENILVAADLIPEVLSAAMLRATAVITSNGRLSNSPTFIYARYLLKKFEGLSSVLEWEKNFKPTCDRRLISELESGRLQNGEYGYPLGVTSGVEDYDDFIRQKISGNRLSRAGMSMRDIVQRLVDEMVLHLFGKERKLFAPGTQKSGGIEKWDDGYQIAQQIVLGLMDCIKQTGGAAQEGDPSLVSSAVSAIVSNVGTAVAKMPDFTAVTNHSSLPSPTGSLNFARRVIRVHINCLCLLKEALGERHSRAFEVALATESSSALAGVLVSNDKSNNSVKVAVGRATKVAASVSSLVVGAVIHGVASLERMVKVFRIKEGLEIMKFVTSSRNARSSPVPRVENSLEVYVHWFRLLIGNCRTVSDGLVVELLGEPTIVALSRMQRTLPLDVVLPPAYSIFGFVIWKPVILTTSVDTFHSMVSAIRDGIKHLPLRELFLRDTQGFYDHVSSDSTDSELAAVFEMNGSERLLKGYFVPLRSRLFLNALLDCKLPQSVVVEGETKISDKLVDALNRLQLAKFHWQWVELKLLLKEQELESSHAKSTAEAIRSLLSPNSEKASTSENENHFVECLLTRLLVRPDAAPLLSEVLRHFGSLIENSMLVSVKWFLGGDDVLYGRKSIRQRLFNVAERRGFSTKQQFWKPWGWCNVEEGGTQSEQVLTEKGLIDLIIPCLDRSSDESSKQFGVELTKQMNNIEQQISGGNKQPGGASSGNESCSSKSSSRKSMKSGSPGMSRRLAAPVDPLPSFPAALRSSISLRLQLLLRLLPSICAQGESNRSMRSTLATVILRLLGSRVVYGDVELSNPGYAFPSKKDRDTEKKKRANALDLSGTNIFELLLLVLHALLSRFQPSWLKVRSVSRLPNESAKLSSAIDRETLDNLQNELERMQLPEAIFRRIRAALPVTLPNNRYYISSQPPTVPSSAITCLKPSISFSSQPNPRNSTLTKVSNPKTKSSEGQADSDIVEIDPWTLLEDGAGSSDNTNLRAATWLKGAVRVRRTDLTYIGAMDEDT